MKKIYFLIVCILFFVEKSNANNLVISGTPIYSSANQTLTFTMSWDNSWSITSGPSNWDAVWIFVKRQKCTGNNNWVHQVLSSTSSNHSAKVTATNVTSDIVSVDAVSDGVGVFVKRIGSNVIGNVASQTVTLKLETATNPSIVTTTSDNFEILGMEMVYVPQGEFYIGDGRPVNSHNFSAGATTQPLKITSSIQSSGLGVYTNYTTSSTYGCAVALPSTFPLGFNGFYCMKYEISQGIIVEYLNSLTYDQQAARLAGKGAGYLANVVGTMFDGNRYFNQTRISTAGVYNTVPAIFTCTYPYIPEASLSWQDFTSFLDWSGLRPMSEFEFEKACRGTLNPVANEYPWGNTIINGVNGSAGHTLTFGTMDGLCIYNWDGSPIRSGFAATSATNRSQAGATYYGILDMGGQTWEQCVGGGNGYNYSTFTTSNGNGELTTNGLANVTGWPTNGGQSSGTILKGGHYGIGANTAAIQVSDRQFYQGTTNNTKEDHLGGRGVRSY